MVQRCREDEVRPFPRESVPDAQPDLESHATSRQNAIISSDSPVLQGEPPNGAVIDPETKADEQTTDQEDLHDEHGSEIWTIDIIG